MPFPMMMIGFFLHSTLIFSQDAKLQDRRPAVEDFVGVELEESKVTPYGDETLFNLEQDVGKIKYLNKRNNSSNAATPRKKLIDPLTFLGISITLSLPFMVWFMVMSHLRKKAHVQNANNIEILEKYRKTREKKSEETLKKVS